MIIHHINLYCPGVDDNVIDYIQVARQMIQDSYAILYVTDPEYTLLFFRLMLVMKGSILAQISWLSQSTNFLPPKRQMHAIIITLQSFHLLRIPFR